MNVTVSTSQSGSYYTQRVEVQNIDTLLRWFSKVDPELEAAVKDGLKEAAEPVLTAARAHARAIASDGTFANSLSLRVYKRGVVKLKSTDVAAGVKEFAKRGAKTRTSKGTPLANARLAKKSGVGVPAGDPPRAMCKAINENINAVANNIEDRLDRVLRS